MRKRKTSSQIKNIIAFFLLFNLFLLGCTQHYTHLKTNKEKNYRSSYTFSIQKNNFYLNYTVHGHFSGFIVVGGYLEKTKDKNIYQIHNFYKHDSINYPVFYRNEKNQDNQFILKIPLRYAFRQLLINDTLFLDTLIKPTTNLPKYLTFAFNEKPNQIQIVDYPFTDLIFYKYEVVYKSIKYIVPDSCNEMTIKNIPERYVPLGIPNLQFNKKTMIIYTEKDTMQMTKHKEELNKRNRTTNRKIFRYYKRHKDSLD